MDYLTDPLRLLKKIEAARQKAWDGDPSGYADAGRELALMLFYADGEDGKTAERAKAALQELVRNSEKTPVVVARLFSSEIVDGRNRTAILPLGLLSATGPDPVLSKPIVVVQPLPRERYTRDTCIEPWTFAVPAELQGVVDEKDRSLLKEPPQWYGQRLHNLEAFKSYLIGRDERGSGKAEGLLVLAHQGGGQLWFNDPGERIQPQEIRRIYPAGSVAVLAACSTASPDGNNRAILERLNLLGIDALIASPFPVTIHYGVPLALEFAALVGEHYRAGRTRTFLELFTEATRRTAQLLAGSGRFEQMGLEYVVLGDPDVTLCGPPDASAARKGTVLVFYRDGQERPAQRITSRLKAEGYTTSAVNHDLSEVVSQVTKETETRPGAILIGVAGNNTALGNALKAIVGNGSRVEIDYGWKFRASEAQVYLF
jgi:hypothetical protein